jgi:hypothetical protein
VAGDRNAGSSVGGDGVFSGFVVLPRKAATIAIADTRAIAGRTKIFMVQEGRPVRHCGFAASMPIGREA